MAIGKVTNLNDKSGEFMFDGRKSCPTGKLAHGVIGDYASKVSQYGDIDMPESVIAPKYDENEHERFS